MLKNYEQLDNETCIVYERDGYTVIHLLPSLYPIDKYTKVSYLMLRNDRFVIAGIEDSNESSHQGLGDLMESVGIARIEDIIGGGLLRPRILTKIRDSHGFVEAVISNSELSVLQDVIMEEIWK